MKMSVTDQMNLQTRKRLLKRELERYVSILSKRPEIIGVIVFGSAVNEREVNEDSDLDLVVVEDTTEPFMKRLKKIRRLLHPKIATDILVYARDEFNKLCENRPFVKEEIVKKGRIMYERERGALA